MRQRSPSQLKPFIAKSWNGYMASSRARWISLCIFLSVVCFIAGVSIRSIVPVAVVNGQAIDSKAFGQRVLLLSGDSVLEEMVITQLVDREAKAKHVVIPKDEFNTEYEQIKKDILSTGVNLNVYYRSIGYTEELFKKELHTQLLIKKMFGQGISVSDKDIQDFMVKNRILQGRGAIFTSQKIALKKVVEREKLRQRFASWIQAELKNAKIKRFI